MKTDAASLYLNTAFLDFWKKGKMKICCVAGDQWFRKRSADSANHPLEWLQHCVFKRYCWSQKIVEVVVVNKIFRHSMAVHQSALRYIDSSSISQAWKHRLDHHISLSHSGAIKKILHIGCLLRLFRIRSFRRRVRYKRRRRMFLNYFATFKATRQNSES